MRAPSGPAFGPGCLVCRWAAVFLLVVCCPNRSSAAARPAREPSAPRASLGASPRSPARPRHRSRAPQPGPPDTPAPSTPAALSVWMCCLVPAISHVIPLGIFQTMNTYRWYCNVLGRSQIMTEGNYVRLLSDPACAVTNRCGRQLCETVITFAGARSVFGETDGTIARQKHRFSALSWCAKVSRVSRKRAEDPVLVLTVSSRRAASSFGAKKFAAPWCGHEAPHSHTQRIQKRPGPRPRALPATHELR